jgi:protein SCO1/2
MIMSKKAISYLVFFALLLGGFYYAMIKYTDFEEVKLPVLNTVQPFAFLRQDSTTASQKDIRNRVYVAEYFFTTCKGICPKMNKNMKAIYEQFKTDSNFLIVSHTVNPDTDSLPVLRHYADSLGADVSNWWFLTGSKESLYKTARESYLLDDPKNSSKNIDEQFLHTQFFTLVDRQGRVRGVYDGIKKEEVDQLMTDIKILIKE